MAAAIDLLRQGKRDELWQQCCGFIDLSIEEFMAIQERLMLEQLTALCNCELGQALMQGPKPKSIEQFRKEVPLTTYEDYAPFLLEQREDVLPEKPLFWQHTSGRSGEYKFKWVPVTERFFEELGPVFMASIIFSSCADRRDINLEEGDRFFYGLAPPPYASGALLRRLTTEFPFTFIPPMEEAEAMSFQERIQEGFKLALSDGMKFFAGMSSVLVAVGERFQERSGSMSITSLLTRPRALLRLLKGLIKSKLARRPMLPRDLWTLKGISGGGTDTPVYREKVKALWGRYLLDAYGGTEFAVIAMQTWDYSTMTFVPNLNFLEFIPEEESLKSREDKSYQPSTVLLDQVKAGERYEVVISSFHGGPFVRYRVGDMIKIAALHNDTLGINLPQMLFETRVDGIVDLAAFTRLTEKTIWQAIEMSGVVYQDWTVRKEAAEKPVLHIYIEPKEGETRGEEQAAIAVHEALKKLDSFYAELESMLGLQPLKVTFLPIGTFEKYTARQQAAGADLAHLKPPHIYPSDEVMAALLKSAPLDGEGL